MQSGAEAAHLCSACWTIAVFSLVLYFQLTCFIFHIVETLKGRHRTTGADYVPTVLWLTKKPTYEDTGIYITSYMTCVIVPRAWIVLTTTGRPSPGSSIQDGQVRLLMSPPADVVTHNITTHLSRNDLSTWNQFRNVYTPENLSTACHFGEVRLHSQ